MKSPLWLFLNSPWVSNADYMPINPKWSTCFNEQAEQSPKSTLPICWAREFGSIIKGLSQFYAKFFNLQGPKNIGGHFMLLNMCWFSRLINKECFEEYRSSRAVVNYVVVLGRDAMVRNQSTSIFET